MKSIFTYILFSVLILGTSCSKDSLSGKIEVKGLVNPDSVKPIVSFVTTAPTSMNGWQDFELEYTAIDDPLEFSGINKVLLFYTPDLDTKSFKLIGEIPSGENQKAQFCVPNSNHPKPVFKIVAFDNNANQSEQMLGHEVGQNFSINIETDPTVPTVSSSLGVLTKDSPVTLNFSECGYNSCSAGSFSYETNPNTTSVLVNTTGVQPTLGDAGWLSCEAVKTSGIPQAAFPSQGGHTYHLWSKSTDTDFDTVTPMDYVSSVSSDVTITYDSEVPVATPANLTFSNDFNFAGDNLVLTWNAFTDMNVVDHRVKTYKDSSCLTSETVHGLTSSNLAADSIIVDGLADGQYWGTVTAVDHVGLETVSACSTDFIIVDGIAPFDNTANIQFTDVLDIDGNDIAVTWTAFTDVNLVDHRFRTYTDSACTIGEVIHSYTGSNTNADAASIDGLPTDDYWAKVEAFDGAASSTLSACSTDSVRVDKDSPIDNGANLQFVATHDGDGNDVSVTWVAFTDGNGFSKHQFDTYTDSGCTAGLQTHGDTGTGALSSDATVIDGLVDGQYWGKVRAYDGIGNLTNSACSTDSIIIDSTAPLDNTATILFALDNTKLNNDVAISWTAFTDDTLTNHRIHLYKGSATCAAGEINVGLTGNASSLDSAIIDGLADGVYNAKVTAIDFLGLNTQSACSADSIIIDRTNPTDNTATLTFTNDYNNTGNDVALTWTAFTDSYLEEHKIITYTNAGCTLGAVDHTYNGSTLNNDSTSVDGLTTGTYWATVTATDVAGNVTTSACSADSIIIDTTVPTDNTALVQFTDDYDIDGNDLALTWTAFSDTNSIADHEILTYTDSGCSANEALHSKTASGTNSNSTVVDSLADDEYWAIVRAFDSAGNSTDSACSTDSIIVDSQDPIDAPADLQFTLTHTNLNDDQAVTWTAFSDVTLKDHQLYTYTDSGCVGGEDDHGLTGSTSASDSAVIDSLAEGEYWAKVKAIDELAQSTTSACSTDSLIVDQTLPVDNGATLTFTNDYNNTGNDVAVTWTAFTDTYLADHVIQTYTNSGCSAGEKIHTATGSATNSDNLVVDGLTDGVYYAKVKAIDEAGNFVLSACSADFITIDTTNPTDNTAVLTFTNTHDNDGDDIAATWVAFSDTNGIADQSLITYTDSGCTTGIVVHPLIGSNATADAVTIDSLADGTKWGKVRAFDPAGNYTDSACSADSIIIDSTNPVDNTANLLFALTHTNVSDDISVSWTAFSDDTLENHRLITYTDSGCSIGTDVHGLTGDATNSNAVIIDGLAEGEFWGKVVAIDHMTFETTSACSTDKIIIDQTVPTDNTANIQFTNDYSATGNNIDVSWTAFTDTYLSDHRLYTYSDSGCTTDEIDHGLTGSATNANAAIIDGLLDSGTSKGIFYAKVKAIDLATNETLSVCSTDFITVDQTDPTDAVANLQFVNDFNNTGNDLSVTWTAFTDTIPGIIADHQITTYTDSACSTGADLHSKTASNTNADAATIDGLTDGEYWARVATFDGAGNTVMSVCSTDSITVDTVAPDESPLLVIGTVVTGQSLGLYKLNTCTDVAFVKITRGAGAPPLDGDAGWQACDAADYTITTTDFIVGVNDLEFWIKDSAGNVQTTYVPHQTFYIPPTIVVENGPTVDTDIADMTINYCAESDISFVLFNETGTAPAVGDAAWQSCSKAIGALKSASLSPGDHTLKAFFKYSDNSISVVPMLVPVRYEPTIIWEESLVTNRPQVTFTIGSCTGVTEVLFNQTTQPILADLNWQSCLTATGALDHTLTASGSQSLNMWYKDSGPAVLSDSTQVTVDFQPPVASIFGGGAISTNSPMLSIDDCSGISKVIVKLDDASETVPTLADFTGGSEQGCTTALNAINTPVLPDEGVHTLDVWFQYNDLYILDPWHSRITVTYTAVDITAPPITGGQGATTPLAMTLNNGDASTPPVIQFSSSRADFTLNTCSPNPDFPLAGTVSVTAGTTAVTGSGTSFTTEILAGDFIELAGETLKVKSVGSNTTLELVIAHTAGAASVSSTKTFPLDDIAGMILTESTTAPLATDPDWLACSTTANLLKSKSLTPDGDHDLYAWFKDAAGNLSATSLHQQVNILTTPDITPPPRPEVIVEGAPTLTVSPAQLTITSCTDVDQIYVEPSVYPAPYVAPGVGDVGWINCTDGIGDINYYLTLSGSYTLSVWFKDTAGNINATPRDVAFIFQPTVGSFTTPIAYWTMDKEHKKTTQVLDMKGDNHLYIWDTDNLTEVAGKSNEAFNFSGTDSYLFAVNDADLQPTISVTMSMWAYLTSSDASTKALAGNIQSGVGGYGFKLESGSLKFYASGQSTSIATSTYSTGWQHIVGTSDGRNINLYINGVIQSSFDMGAPANLTYGCTQVFAIGSDTDCTVNPSSSNSFDERVDEVVIWGQYFTETEVMSHFIDSYNDNKVGVHTTKPADVTTASFYGEFLQNALLTVDSCGDNKFIYVNETTHPPTVDTDDWQLCSTVMGGTIHKNLPQGPHELKIWGKDEYNNITASYLKVDTTITGLEYEPPGLLYYSFDNNHLNLNTTYDLFSKHHATNVGASANQAAIQNEGFLFERANSDYVERKYSSNTQPKDKVTISAWVNLTQGDNVAQVIAGNKMAGHGYSLEIDNANSELRFIVESAAGTRFAGVSTAGYSSGFHQLIGVYDGQNTKLYIDSVEIDSQDGGSISPISYSCLGAFMIGAGAGTTCNSGPVAATNFDNVIDEVFVWNNALSQTTIDFFFSGSDTVPPLPVGVTPKDAKFTVGIPLARLNTTSCSDIASVYTTLETVKPLADIDNWQPCATIGDTIKSSQLVSGVNEIYVWFKDAAGNVSDTFTQIDITYSHDLTIPNPDSYWTMDLANIDGSNVFDVVSAKNGVKSGALTSIGQSDEALIFNGTSDFVEVPFDASFQPVRLTLSAWFKVSSYDVADHIIVGNLNAGGYELALGNNTVEFRVEAQGATQVASSSTGALATDTWHHVAGVWDDGRIRFFVNGVEELDSQIVPSGSVEYSNTNSLIIGAASTSTVGQNGDFFNGEIDEVAFWSSALTNTVVDEIFERGTDHDKVFYDVIPPTIPVSLNILYYNSLVSRANLTVTDCTGLDYIIVTNDEFPPDLNDEDWQLCNTLTGGLLSKELASTENYGKFWTKDLFGNISKAFEYVPLVTNYDKPISRPVVHWTFDESHYNAGTREVLDRISQIQLKNDRLVLQLSSLPDDCISDDFYDGTAGAVVSGGTGVLNEGLSFTDGKWLRSDHPANAKTKPTDTISVATWVYLTGSTAHTNEHIVSTEHNGKGWALRLDATNQDDKGLRFTVHTTGGVLEPYLETKNYVTGWHLVVGVYDGQAASLYFDGIFVKSFSNSSPESIVYEPGVNTIVGAQASTNETPTLWRVSSKRNGSMGSCPTSTHVNSYFNGSIDEVIVWDKSLNALEASSLYHNGADILYPSDTTAPSLPSLTLENTRPNMFSDKAYFTLNTCSDISGVLVNEGTRPDKQDDRWEICRTRRGSFGIENLTDGGHTITSWYKDLAGNVTPLSADLVVNYSSVSVPYANASWPLDAASSVSNEARDVVELGVHDLIQTNIDTPAYPLATHTAGKVNEGINLQGGGSYLSAKSTTLLSPVNFMSVGGWFNLTQSDGGTKILIDHHEYNDDTSRGGYKIYINGGFLTFKIELDIVKTKTLSYSTGGYTTGWHHVIGVWTGLEVLFYIDGVQIATSGTLAERDYMRYDDSTDFRIGAESDDYANPTNFFNGEVDEIALWGFDLNATQVSDAKIKGDSASHVADPLSLPADVDNAFIYHYDNFGSRTRMTLLDCTNTPWIYVTHQGGAAPSADGEDWRECRTDKGAILSEKLPLNTTYVDLYSKNADGIVSTAAGTKEILPIIQDYDLVLPIIYHSFNNDHINGTTIYDFMSQISSTSFGTPSSASNLDGDEFVLDGVDDYIDIPSSKNFDLRKNITIAVWADITNGDSSNKTLVSRITDPNDTALMLENGKVKFKVNIVHGKSYLRTSDYTSASFSTSNIPTGKHFIVGIYDGTYIKLYIDSNLVSQVDPGYNNFTTTNSRSIAMDDVNGFRVSDTTTTFWQGGVDEFMVFDQILSSEEIDAHYRRYSDMLNPADSSAPATIPGISVVSSTFGGNWPTNNSNPKYTLDNCTDIDGVFITVDDPTAPEADIAGWQVCLTDEGHFEGPILSAGNHTVYFWFRDANGNVSTSQSTDVNYSIPALYTPVAYWSMDEDSFVSKTNYEPVNLLHAQLYEPRVVPGVAGLAGTALDFDGSREYVEVEHSSIIKPVEKLSVAFWAKINSSDAVRDYRTIIGNRGNTAEGFVFKWTCEDAPCNASAPPTADEEFFDFILNLEGTDYKVTLPQQLVGSGWKHFVGTFDGRYIRLFIDGVLRRELDVGSEKNIYYNPASNTSLIMGADASDVEKPSGAYFEGSLDEVTIWDKALFPAQVTDLYNNFANNSTRVFDPGLANITPPDTRTTIHNPGEKSFGSRLRLTISDCTDMNMILVSDSTTAPALNDENWQACNTYDGGILSSPLPAGLITPQVWSKSFTGTISAASGTANSATYTVPVYVTDIPRPIVHWPLDSATTGYFSNPDIFDSLSWAHGELHATTPPETTVTSGGLSVIEKGFSFNGIDELIGIHATAATNPMYDLTISAWVELNKGETQTRNIVGNIQNNLSATGAGSGLRLKGGELQFYVTAWDGSGTRNYAVGVDSNLFSSGLHHVTGVYNGQDLKLYLDGVFVKKFLIQFFGGERYWLYHDDYSNWTIGAETDAGNIGAANSFFSGVIDDIRIWHTPLTEQQVFYAYEYGSDFLPTSNSDGIAPTDPGIFIADYQTTTSMPWMNFTMPTCAGANGVEVNAIYINTDSDAAPSKDDLGWQFCSLDSAYLISTLMNRGASNITVYFRDEEGDISSSTTFPVAYDPPDLIHPKAYYTFNAADRTSNRSFNDLAGNITISQSTYTDSGITTGIFDDGWKMDNVGASQNDYEIDNTSMYDYEINRDFTVSFWFKPAPVYSTETSLFNTGRLHIYRSSSDGIQVNAPDVGNKQSLERLVPSVWNHITVSRKDRNMKIYLNGKLDSSHYVSNNNLKNTPATMVFGKSDGVYDELVMYTSQLTDEQVAYIYFKGIRQEYIDVMPENLVEAPTPTHYWNFDNSSFSDPTLNSVVGGIDLDSVSAVTAGEVGKVGESINFTRFENQIFPGADPSESQNTLGTPQYLSSSKDDLLTLPAEFTMSLWVKQTQGTGYEDDKTMIIDQWGIEKEDQLFKLEYDRETGASYTFTMRFGNNDSEDIKSIETSLHSFASNTGWVNLIVRRNGGELTMYVNGRESSAKRTDRPSAMSLTAHSDVRLLFGESNTNGFSIVPGTVSIVATTSSAVGIATSFTTDLYKNKTGIVSINAGTNIVTGIGSLFNLEFIVGDRVVIAGEEHVVASVTGLASMTLVSNHVAGAYKEKIRKYNTGTADITSGTSLVTGTGTLFTTEFANGNRIRIGNEYFTILNIATDTSLTVNEIAVDTYATANISLEQGMNFKIASEDFYVRRILDDSNLELELAHTLGATADLMFSYDGVTSDENGLNGNIDEFAIWGEPLTHQQIWDIYQKGLAGQAISIEPKAILGGAITIVNTPSASLTLNSCNGYTHVWVGTTADLDPADATPGWVACSTLANAISTGLLTIDSINNLKLWFKTATVVSTYTTTIDVTHVSGDTLPPIIPGIVMESAATTDLSFARFTIASCSDIDGIYVGLVGPSPISEQAGWKNCTTINSAVLSNVLDKGSNDIAIWFKDSVGNVTSYTDFTVTHNVPTITNPNIYFTFDNDQSENIFLRDIGTNKLAQSTNSADITKSLTGQVDESIQILLTGYYELLDDDFTIVKDFTFASWVFLNTLSTDATLVNKWDEAQTEDQYAIRVDSTGRICLDVQTAASTATWNTDSYKRVCSSGKIEFNEWGHVGIIKDNGLVKFFYNNVLVGSESVDTSNLIATTLALRIGGQERGTNNSPANGELDELAMWDSVLTSTEFESVYAQGFKGSQFKEDMQVQHPAVAENFWDFDNASFASPTLPDLMLNVDVNDALINITSGATGQINEAFTFTNNNYLESASNSIALGTDFTISTWVNLTDDSDDLGTILSKWTPGTVSEQEFRLYTSTGVVKFDYHATLTGSDVYPILGFDTISSINTIPNGQWSHIVVTRKGEYIYLYLNGSLEAVKEIGPDPMKNLLPVPLRFGGEEAPSVVNFFSGSIDDTIIMKSYSDERQVQYIHDEGIANTKSSTSVNPVVSVAEASSTVSSLTAKLSISDCKGYAKIMVQDSGVAAPAAGTLTVNCRTAVGAYQSPGLPATGNTVDVYLGDGAATVVGPYSVIINYAP